MRPVRWILLLFALFAAAGVQAATPIAQSKHNLSVTGPGTVKATSEAEICVFCHAPHNAVPGTALWNRGTPSPAGGYVPYASATAKGNAGQPTGASLMCLSCHDGTIALGSVLSRSTAIAVTGAVSGTSLLGTNLSDDHPISIRYNSQVLANPEILNPSTLTGRVRLDATGQLQCTSCHDPHDDSIGKFLVMDNVQSKLCMVCHAPNLWNASQASHRVSSSTWNNSGTNPWPHTSWTTVANNACENCHRPHTAGGASWLLNLAAEESNCYACHNGTMVPTLAPTTRNIGVQSEFNKVSIHPVASYTGVHAPNESGVVQTRHVECVDCHNPHASNAASGSAPAAPMIVPGSLAGVSGIDIANNPVKPVTAEYQVCLRCHGDSPGQPAPKTTRVLAQANTRLDFQTSNQSCHPVAGACPRVNPASALLAPWNTWNSTITMKCSDCHNNNAGPGNNGTGPRGPHGSTNPSLLERPNTGSAPQLCAKCHSVTTFTKFNNGDGHSKHLGGDVRATCNDCHDPHGSRNYPSMINFNTAMVISFTSLTPASAGQANNGRCSLNCHAPGGSRNHNNEPY